ncbi:SH2 domain-containing protein [Gorgonomyces haynaldii]|nr:SH2 domain-containing protein [Gorgonomyces haynaldii]
MKDSHPVSEDSEEEEEEEEEMTEADKQFIADDDEEEEEIGYRRRKKKKRERKVEEDFDNLSEDDLDLINENQGRNKKTKRLKLRAVDEDDLAKDLFDDDEKEEDEDLDDFIVREDEDDLETEEMLLERQMQRRQQRLQNQGILNDIQERYGVDDDMWDDITAIFGTGQEYDWALYPDQAVPQDEEEAPKKQKEITLKDVYEPTEIKSKMLTEEDDMIRVRDIPERMQLKGEPSVPTDAEIAKEALYITRLFMKERQSVSEKAMLTCVTCVLRFLKRDHLEVPFIKTHRKDYYDGILFHYDLWKIVDLDEQYVQAERKKKSLYELLERINSLNPDAKNSTPYQLLEHVMTLDEANDVQQLIQVEFSAELDELNQVNIKRRVKKAQWKQLYEEGLKNNIGEFCQLFNIDISSYIHSITTQQTTHFPEDDTELPMDAASHFVSQPFPSPELVLQAARIIIGQRIAAQPSVKNFIRRVYQTDAVVTVTPTEKGRKEIDSRHPYYAFKYLTAKHVFNCNDQLFLQLLDAETNGLITIDIKVEEEERLMEDVCKFICNDYVNERSIEWNKERTKIADYCFREILFPYAAKWLKEKQALLSSQYVATACQLALEKKINIAPFRNTQHQDGAFEDEAPIVMSISWGEGQRNSPAYCAIIGETGELRDYIKLELLTLKDRHGDVDRLMDMCMEHAPEVIVIGGFTPSTKTQLLKIMIEEVSEKGASLGKYSTPIPVLLVEDEVARLYMNSKTSEQQFPEYPPLLRYCISLGRKTQNPTLEYCALYNNDEDWKAIRLHPQQHLLPDDTFKACVERAYINIVNTCGVDINLAANHAHLSHSLQFVSGLGPRKAQAMISKITRTGGKLESRADLIKKGLCGARIFINCASFIRVRGFHFKASYRESTLDVLDDTRIHPEDYELARKMAADALDLDDAVLEDDDNPSQHVQDLMENEVERLNLLMLDDYAVELERQIHEPKKICLHDIKDELMHPFSEKRNRFMPATPDEAFFMLTGESDATLREGTLTSASVLRAKDRFLVCQLPSGIEGLVFFKELDLPYGHEEEPRLTELYESGTILPVIVLKLDKERLSVELTARKASLDQPQPGVPKDEFFSVERERDDEAKYNRIEKKVRPKQSRIIPHPFFKDMDYKEAQEYLSTRPLGDIVVRPSTKGNNHLSITWKCDNDMVQHLDVLELQKENEWTLGKKLKIDELEFNEIDQIVAEYIEPMVRKIQMMQKHPKYQKKTLTEMFDFIDDQVVRNKRSAYGFISNQDKPGSFYLVYKHPSASRKFEVVSVKTNGYMFRKKLIPRIDDLLAFFKHDEASKAQQQARRMQQERPKQQTVPDPRLQQRDPRLERPQAPQESRSFVPRYRN